MPKAKVELLKEYHLPVWVMEPLARRQAGSPWTPEDEAKLKALRPEERIPAWAFRFLQTIPERQGDSVRHVQHGADAGEHRAPLRKTSP